MKNLLLFFVSVLLVGCDQFPGPTARSEFPTPVKLTVAYSDGEMFSHEWSPCQRYKLGAMGVGRFGVKAKKEVSLVEVVVEAEGKVIHRFDKAMIDSLIDKEKKEGGYPIWVVDESGVHFSTSRECSLNQAVQ